MYLLHVSVLVVYFCTDFSNIKCFLLTFFFDNLTLNLINDFILTFDGFTLTMTRKPSVNSSYSIKSLETRQRILGWDQRFKTKYKNVSDFHILILNS